MMISVFLFLIMTSVIIFYKFFYVQGNLNERLYLSIATVFLSIILISFILTRFGLFNLFFLSLILIVSLATALTVEFKASNNKTISQNIAYIPAESFFYPVLFSLMMLYMLFPIYYMLGGRDPGLYFIFSVHISNTGGLNLDLPILRELYKEYGDAIRLGYPGIYSAFKRGLSEDPARLIPQFMHLFPAFGAVAHQIAGLEGVVRANATIAVISLWSFFIVTKRLVGFYPALLAMLALGINGAFIWNARITLTETLSIAFFFSGLFFLIKAFDLRSSRWAFIAGAILGLAILNRLDASLSAFVIFSVFLVSAYRKEYYNTIALPMLLAYLSFSSLAFLDGYFNTYPYLHDLWAQGSLKGLLLINYLLPTVGFLVYHFSKRRVFHFLTNEYTILLILRILILLLAAWMLFAFFVWPLMQDTFNARALTELGWYVTPPLFVLTIYGLWSSSNRLHDHPVLLALITLALFSIFIYSWRPSITPDHIWASRRWLPHVIPLIILFSTVALSEIAQKVSLKFAKFFLVFAVFSFYLGSSVFLAKPFIFNSIYEKSKGGYLSAKNFLQSEKIDFLLTKNYHLASMFTYVYGIDTIGIENKIKFDGYHYLGFDDFDQGKILHPVMVCGDYLEKLRGRKPKTLYKRCYNASIGILSSTSPIHYHMLPTNTNFGTKVGTYDHNNHSIKSTGARGFLLFGPYIPIQPGSYEVTWFGGSNVKLNREIGFVDVVFNKGKNVVVRESINLSNFKEGKITSLKFEIENSISDLEFRLFLSENIDMYVSEIQLRQVYE